MKIDRKKFFEIIGITAVFSFITFQKPIKIFNSLFNKNKIVIKSNPLSVKRTNKV